MRRLALLLTALIGLVPVGAVSAVGTQAPEGQIGIRLLDAPEDRRDDPRARLYVVDHLNQGDVIERRIEVSNTTGRPAALSLYAAAASVVQGSFTFGEGRAQNDLTSWTTVTPDAVTVPPGGTGTAVVRVAVPDDAADGERYAVVWAEASSTGEGSIAQVSRVGVRMYVSVGQGAEPESDFTVTDLTAVRRDGRPVILATVTNTGQRALDMSGQLQLLDGPGGLSAGPFDATLGTTLGIGESAPVETVLDPALPDGPWNARVTLRSGELERTAEASVTFTDEALTVPARVSEDSSLLWPAVVAAVLLALLALFLFVVWRRRRDDEDGEEPAPAAG